MDSALTVSCTSCNVAVTGADGVRAHYRSDVHLVNVKRRVGGLAPLSAVEFAHRVQLLDAAKREQQRPKRSVHCDVCQKRFASEKAFSNHELSRRHRDKMRAVRAGDADCTSSVHSAEPDDARAAARDGGAHGSGDALLDELHDELHGDAQEAERVLRERLARWRTRRGFGGVFDDAWFDDAQQALAHMERGGLFVAFRDRLTDVHGLVQYLSQKVGVGFACVLCDRPFGSADAARRHMRDAGHCGMTDSDEEWMLEFGQFYDWGWDGGDGGSDGSNDGGSDGGWEEVEDGDAEGGAAPRVGALVDGGDGDGEEVALVVRGRELGHRSLRRFYAQRARGEQRREAVEAARGERGVAALSRRAERDGALPLRVRRLAEARRARRQLDVARKTYYTRKARFRQRFCVLNSGYRA